MENIWFFSQSNLSPFKIFLTVKLNCGFSSFSGDWWRAGRVRKKKQKNKCQYLCIIIELPKLQSSMIAKTQFSLFIFKNQKILTWSVFVFSRALLTFETLHSICKEGWKGQMSDLGSPHLQSAPILYIVGIHVLCLHGMHILQKNVQTMHTVFRQTHK